MGTQVPVILLLNSRRAEVQGRVEPGDARVERSVGVLPHVVVRIVFASVPAGVGTDLANTVPSAARISPRALSEWFAEMRGLCGEFLQRLALDQLDVHQLHDHQAEAHHHDDTEPSDSSSHQRGGCASGGRGMPSTPSMVGRRTVRRASYSPRRPHQGRAAHRTRRSRNFHKVLRFTAFTGNNRVRRSRALPGQSVQVRPCTRRSSCGGYPHHAAARPPTNPRFAADQMRGSS